MPLKWMDRQRARKTKMPLKCKTLNNFFLDRYYNLLLRGWSLCEIRDQAGAGFYKPGQQQRLMFPVPLENVEPRKVEVKGFISTEIPFDIQTKI